MPSAYASTITELTFALGGLENIVCVDNCMSRLRITTLSPPPAEDKDFLAIGFLGVVHQQDQIHLICGADAIPLRHEFQCLLNAEKDTVAFPLLAAMGGSRNIAQVISGTDPLEFRLHSPIPLPPVPGFDIKYSGHSLLVSSLNLPLKTLYVDIQSILLFWDFLYALKIYRLFASYGIKHIAACRTRLKLKVSTMQGIQNHYPALALEALLLPEESTVHIPCPAQAEPYGALIKRFFNFYEKSAHK